MRFVDLLTSEHSKRLPYVRIKSVELTNFKSVKHGLINILGKETVPYDTESSILGLYGQNGSGKSVLVEALSMVRGLMFGYKLGSSFANYIDVNADYSLICVQFEFQYTNGITAPVEYSFKVNRLKDKDTRSIQTSQEVSAARSHVAISEEVIKTTIYPDGKVGRLHTIVDTKDSVFAGDTCIREYFGDNYDSVRDELVYLKRKCAEESRSFVFSPDLAELLHSDGLNKEYTEVLSELSLFATRYLFVISTRTSAFAQLRQGVPVNIPSVYGPILLNDRTPIQTDTAKYIDEVFSELSSIVATIIPDLKLVLEKIPTKNENGDDAMYLNLMSVRGDKKIPFDNESDGIIKIVSILADFVFVFNNWSATLVIDEFDAGVFEYLLGELLEIFEEYGKGQLIFTSHNLRPLEIIDKKFIWFTTSDPENRYCKLKNVGASNNLRDMYLKTVQLGDTDIEFYKKIKAFKIVKAIKAVAKEPENEV